MILECDLTVYTEQCCLLIIYSWFLKRRNNWILPKQKIEKWKIMAMHGRCMEELIKGKSSPWSCASLKSLVIRFLVILCTKLLHWRIYVRKFQNLSPVFLNCHLNFQYRCCNTKFASQTRHIDEHIRWHDLYSSFGG